MCVCVRVRVFMKILSFMLIFLIYFLFQYNFYVTVFLHSNPVRWKIHIYCFVNFVTQVLSNKLEKFLNERSIAFHCSITNNYHSTFFSSSSLKHTDEWHLSTIISTKGCLTDRTFVVLNRSSVNVYGINSIILRTERGARCSTPAGYTVDTPIRDWPRAR